MYEIFVINLAKAGNLTMTCSMTLKLIVYPSIDITDSLTNLLTLFTQFGIVKRIGSCRVIMRLVVFYQRYKSSLGCVR